MNIQEVVDTLGDAFDKFKDTHNDRLDKIEKDIMRLNRPNFMVTSSSENNEDRKALDTAVRALIAGKQADADIAFKGMQAGIDPDGGYVVTPTFSNEMTRVMLEVAPFIGLPRTVELTSGSTFEEPLDKDEAGADWVGETQTRSETDSPQLGLIRIEAHEICAMPQVTQKLIDTARIDVVQWLQGKVAEKFAHTEVDAFINGNGVAKPRGFLSYTTAATAEATRAWGVFEHVPTGASGAFKAANANPADCLIDLVAALKPQYRQGAVFLMNRATLALVRKLKDSQSRFLLVDSIIAGQPNTLLGYPVVECEQMPDPAADSLSIAFGNFSKGYTIVRRLGTRFLVDPYTNKPHVRLYSYARVGGDATNFEAIKLLKFATS